MATLHGVELYRAELRLRAPIVTAAGVHDVRPVAFVRVMTDVGDGWGECAALQDGTLVDPPFDTVIAALEAQGVTRLLAAAAAREGELPAAAQVPALFGSSPVAHFVAATTEMAVLAGGAWRGRARRRGALPRSPS